jgi:hypothetical protein
LYLRWHSPTPQANGLTLFSIAINSSCVNP